MLVRIYPADHVLHRFANQIGALGEVEAHKALARAINRVTDTVHGRVIRALVKQTSAPRALVASQVKKRQVRPGGMGDLEGVVWATGSELSLRYFSPRQIKAGTKAKVWGRAQLFPHAFMGPKPGAVAASLRGHVYKRTGADRLPIEKLFGPSIPKEMVKDHTAAVFEQTVAEMLPRRVEHELARLLPK